MIISIQDYQQSVIDYKTEKLLEFNQDIELFKEDLLYLLSCYDFDLVSTQDDVANVIGETLLKHLNEKL